MKKILSFMLAAVLCFSLVACTDGNKDSSSGADPGKKPNAIVDQDLSMFDTIKHYGIKQVEKFTLTLKGENATFANGSKQVELIENSSLPQIKLLKEDEYVKEVIYTESGKAVKDYRFRMPKKDCEIEITTTTEKPAYFKQLNIGTDYNGNVGFDYQSSAKLWVDWNQTKSGFDSNSPFTMNREYSIEVDEKNVDISGNSEEDFLRGVTLKLSGVAGNAARMLTGTGEAGTEEGIAEGQTYAFTYNFQNFGENEISFRAYQAQGGIKLAGAVAVNAGQDITLKAGESVSYTISFTATNKNTNIIPLLELRSTFDETLLGIAIGKENVELKCTHKIEKFAAKDGDCGKAGNDEYYGCRLCGGMWSDENGENVIDMTNITVKKEHTPSDEYAGITPTEHSILCSVCHGGISYESHKFSFVTVKEPTETEKGLQEEVCACGYKTGETKELSGKYMLTVVTDDGEKSYSVKVDGKLPEEAKTYLGDTFFDVDNPTVIYTADDFKMPAEDIKIQKIDNLPGITMTPCNGTTGPMDRFPANASALTYEKISTVKVGNKAYLGKELCITPQGATSFSVRTKSAYGAVTTVNNFTFYVTIENRNSFDLTFNIAQVNAGQNKFDSAKEDNVTLKPGEARMFTFTFPSNVGTNENALTLIDFKEVNGEPIVIGYALSYEAKA